MAGPKSDLQHQIELELLDFLGRFKPTSKAEVAWIVVRALLNDRVLTRYDVAAIVRGENRPPMAKR